MDGKSPETGTRESRNLIGRTWWRTSEDAFSWPQRQTRFWSAPISELEALTTIIEGGYFWNGISMVPIGNSSSSNAFLHPRWLSDTARKKLYFIGEGMGLPWRKLPLQNDEFESSGSGTRCFSNITRSPCVRLTNLTRNVDRAVQILVLCFQIQGAKPLQQVFMSLCFQRPHATLANWRLSSLHIALYWPIIPSTYICPRSSRIGPGSLRMHLFSDIRPINSCSWDFETFSTMLDTSWLNKLMAKGGVRNENKSPSIRLMITCAS